MSNIIEVNFMGHVAPESDCVALVECVEKTIVEFGEQNFALAMAHETAQEEQLAA